MSFPNGFSREEPAFPLLGLRPRVYTFTLLYPRLTPWAIEIPPLRGSCRQILTFVAVISDPFSG
jgi:hypothetical protein